MEFPDRDYCTAHFNRAGSTPNLHSARHCLTATPTRFVRKGFGSKTDNSRGSKAPGYAVGQKSLDILDRVKYGSVIELRGSRSICT